MRRKQVPSSPSFPTLLAHATVDDCAYHWHKSNQVGRAVLKLMPTFLIFERVDRSRGKGAMWVSSVVQMARINVGEPFHTHAAEVVTLFVVVFV